VIKPNVLISYYNNLETLIMWTENVHNKSMASGSERIMCYVISLDFWRRVLKIYTLWKLHQRI